MHAILYLVLVFWFSYTTSLTVFLYWILAYLSYNWNWLKFTLYILNIVINITKCLTGIHRFIYNTFIFTLRQSFIHNCLIPFFLKRSFKILLECTIYWLICLAFPLFFTHRSHELSVLWFGLFPFPNCQRVICNAKFRVLTLGFCQQSCLNQYYKIHTPTHFQYHFLSDHAYFWRHNHLNQLTRHLDIQLLNAC